jgi:uncharacterized protein DUF5659
MEEKNHKSPFRTPDLYFAAYLVAVGVEMLSPEHISGRVYFLFEVDEEMEALKHGWFSGSGVVPAMPYANAIKNLKSMVHQK